MPFHKLDALKASNCLQLYRKNAHNIQDAELESTIDRLIEAFDSDLFITLLDIHEKHGNDSCSPNDKHLLLSDKAQANSNNLKHVYSTTSDESDSETIKKFGGRLKNGIGDERSSFEKLNAAFGASPSAAAPNNTIPSGNLLSGKRRCKKHVSPFSSNPTLINHNSSNASPGGQEDKKHKRCHHNNNHKRCPKVVTVEKDRSFSSSNIIAVNERKKGHDYLPTTTINVHHPPPIILENGRLNTLNDSGIKAAKVLLPVVPKIVEKDNSSSTSTTDSTSTTSSEDSEESYSLSNSENEITIFESPVIIEKKEEEEPSFPKNSCNDSLLNLETSRLLTDGTENFLKKEIMPLKNVSTSIATPPLVNHTMNDSTPPLVNHTMKDFSLQSPVGLIPPTSSFSSIVAKQQPTITQPSSHINVKGGEESISPRSCTEIEFRDMGYGWELLTFTLIKNGKGLGFTLSGGSDNNTFLKFEHGKESFVLDIHEAIIVTKLIPGGTAQLNGNLKVDDIILQVNETDITSIEHDRAVEILKNTGNSVNLTVKRLRKLEPSIQDTIILKKGITGGLGFSITGGIGNEHSFLIGDVETDPDPGIFIAKIIPGGRADDQGEGRLRIDDKLIKVNSNILTGLTHEQAVDELKSISPNSFVCLEIQRLNLTNTAVTGIKQVQQRQSTHLNGHLIQTNCISRAHDISPSCHNASLPFSFNATTPATTQQLTMKDDKNIVDQTDNATFLIKNISSTSVTSPQPVAFKTFDPFDAVISNSGLAFRELSEPQVAVFKIDEDPITPIISEEYHSPLIVVRDVANQQQQQHLERVRSKISPISSCTSNTTPKQRIMPDNEDTCILLDQSVKLLNSASLGDKRKKYRSPLIKELRDKLNIDSSASSSSSSINNVNHVDDVEIDRKESMTHEINNFVISPPQPLSPSYLAAQPLNVNSNNSNDITTFEITPTNTANKAVKNVIPDIEMRKFDQRKHVVLCRSTSPNRSLGFNITGGYVLNKDTITAQDPIYIAQIVQGKPAALSGLIEPGDEIIAVNGQNIIGFSHQRAVQALKDASGQRVFLELLAPSSGNNITEDNTFNRQTSKNFPIASRDDETLDRSHRRSNTSPPLIPPKIRNSTISGSLATTNNLSSQTLSDRVCERNNSTDHFKISNHSSPPLASHSVGAGDGGEKVSVAKGCDSSQDAGHLEVSRVENAPLLNRRRDFDNDRKNMQNYDDERNNTLTNPTLKRSLFVRALFDYNPSRDRSNLPGPGLPFQFGDLLYLINASDEHWWKAQRLVPYRDYYPITTTINSPLSTPSPLHPFWLPSMSSSSPHEGEPPFPKSASLEPSLVAYKDKPFGELGGAATENESPKLNRLNGCLSNDTIDFSTDQSIAPSPTLGLIPSINRVRKRERIHGKTVKFKGANSEPLIGDRDKTNLNESTISDSSLFYKNGSSTSVLSDSVDNVANMNHIGGGGTNTLRRKIRKNVFFKLPSFAKIKGNVGGGKEYVLDHKHIEIMNGTEDGRTDTPLNERQSKIRENSSSLSLNRIYNDGCELNTSMLPPNHHTSSQADLLSLIYQPVTLKLIPYKRPILLLGPLKDRISDELLRKFPERFATCVPHTSRPQRPNEIDGKDYHFVTPDLGGVQTMEESIRAGKFIEAGQYNGNLYGTSLDAIVEVSFHQQKHCILDVSGNAIQRLASNAIYPIVVFINPTSHLALMELNPEMTEDEAYKAFEKAQIIHRDFISYFNGIVQTDSLEKMFQNILSIINQHVSLKLWVSTGEIL